MEQTTTRTAAELEAGMPEVLAAPRDAGTLELIVRRPTEGARELLETGTLDLEQGLVGDRWAPRQRGNRETQLTLMNVRVLALLEDDRERWPLAGDQLIVDLDLSNENLPPGSRLAIGSTVVEVTPVPHTGCKKFSARFGVEAVRFISTPQGKALSLRGINAKVVTPGDVHRGDDVRKLL